MVGQSRLSPGAGDGVQGSRKPMTDRELDKILALLAEGVAVPWRGEGGGVMQSNLQCGTGTLTIVGRIRERGMRAEAGKPVVEV